VGFDAITWIRGRFRLERADSARFIYGTQPTLSNYAQPGIYKPWDPRSGIHFRLRARVLDWASVMAGRRVLDFGPGEGFPSLLLAPYVREVVGVDGSAKRVQECAGNAQRMGVTNASFVHVPPGEALPFPDASFDGAVASWSLEQSPSLRRTLREIHRVLRPGGVFRFEPETLGRYANGQERQAWLPDAIGGFNGLTLFDRDIAAERVRHYGLLFDEARRTAIAPILEAFMRQHSPMPPISALSEDFLTSIEPFVTHAGEWVTEHPSFTSWPRWLSEAGFASTRVTYSGGWMADRAFQLLAEDDRPASLQAMDALLGPMARIAAQMDSPVPPTDEDYLFVTATK
jgi:ubiquinone/menaquinone biosynthesis C-methylase UbiE